MRWHRILLLLLLCFFFSALTIAEDLKLPKLLSWSQQIAVREGWLENTGYKFFRPRQETFS